MFKVTHHKTGYSATYTIDEPPHGTVQNLQLIRPVYRHSVNDPYKALAKVAACATKPNMRHACPDDPTAQWFLEWTGERRRFQNRKRTNDIDQHLHHNMHESALLERLVDMCEDNHTDETC